MSLYVEKSGHHIDSETRSTISQRRKKICRAINREFWESDSEKLHSFYVGSYGRGTAISTSDIDILHELPNEEYLHFTEILGNGQSRLLQAVKNAILSTYSNTDIKGDGQVVIVQFSDGIKFDILPGFKKLDVWGEWDGTYKYPDTHMGGNWLSTNPIAEIEAMKTKNRYEESNGLLIDTCKHIRFIRDTYYSSYHLSGILIDSFVYRNISDWHWLRDGEKGSEKPKGTYEQRLLDAYHIKYLLPDIYAPELYAPGSNATIDTGCDWDVLGKVLKKMVG